MPFSAPPHALLAEFMLLTHGDEAQRNKLTLVGMRGGAVRTSDGRVRRGPRLVAGGQAEGWRLARQRSG